MTNPLKGDAYDNCFIQSRSGEIISGASLKKVEWYTKNNLGTIVQTDPNVIVKLHFEHKPKLHPSFENYMSAVRRNRCVACGIVDNLTKHHIVPRCYSKYFPSKFKKYNFYDLVPLCISCHNTYEVSAQEYKTELMHKYNLKPNPHYPFKSKKYSIAYAYANLLIKCEVGSKEYLMLRKKICGALDKYVSDGFIEWIVEQNGNPWKTGSSDYQRLINKIQPNYNDFILKWRHHFINNAKPKYMPEFWSTSTRIPT